MDDVITRAGNARKAVRFSQPMRPPATSLFPIARSERWDCAEMDPCFASMAANVGYHIDDLDTWSEARSKTSVSDSNRSFPALPKGNGHSDT